jgi:glycosyltransferase involved in cell wall biosynthesis
MNVTLFRDLPTEHWLSMERYADELATALPALGCNVQSYAPRRPLPNRDGRVGTLLNYAWRSLAYPLAARAQQCDINHIIDHSYAHLVNALDASRTVVTCHDIAPLVFDPPGQGISHRLWQRSLRAMRRAAHIIADSTHTRNDLIQRLDYPPQQISVVPLGVSDRLFTPAAPADIQTLREKSGLSDCRLVVHIGSCLPRKNLELIIRALPSWRGEKVMFAQIGGQFTASQRDLIATLDTGSYIRQVPRASDYELNLWYQAADVFVFPSLYEGFGMPVVEAMASGTPVVCADATSLPEVAGDAALLHDPADAAQLAEAVRTVLNDFGLANDLRERGRKRARLFTWERTARETLAVYQQVLAR